MHLGQTVSRLWLGKLFTLVSENRKRVFALGLTGGLSVWVKTGGFLVSADSTLLSPIIVK
jgi:hypothetical protein